MIITFSLLDFSFMLRSVISSSRSASNDCVPAGTRAAQATKSNAALSRFTVEVSLSVRTSAQVAKVSIQLIWLRLTLDCLERRPSSKCRRFQLKLAALCLKRPKTARVTLAYLRTKSHAHGDPVRSMRRWTSSMAANVRERYH